jgi:bis(5'-nucleosyl)-tetraphosphatase (symmetrical)
MTTWVIGDVQGCWQALQRLLAAIRFDPQRDRVWLAGDLVNRGEDSLAVLQWASRTSRRHPHSVQAVLGNHDLHLLARAAGLAPAKRRDTLDGVLGHRSCSRLCAWLARQPLAVQLETPERPLLLHAGVLPQWTLQEVLDGAREASAILRSRQRRLLLHALVDKTATVPARVRRAADFVAIVTRLRCCNTDGSVDGSFDGPPAMAPAGLTPWFAMPGRKTAGQPIVFGHWAALGARRGQDWTSLDSGCVWGRQLTALELETGQLHSVAATA